MHNAAAKQPDGNTSYKSPLQNLYPDRSPDPEREPLFQQPDVSDEPVAPLDEPEEGLISESEEPDLDTDHDKDVDMDKTVTEDQSYRETVKTVRAYMGWNYIPDLEYTVSSRADNPWTDNRSQPVVKISVAMPPEDWLCRKLESLNLIVCTGYQIRGTESGRLHRDQFIRPPKSQSRWYGLHSGFDPAASPRPGRYVSHWKDDAATLNSMYARIAKATGTASTPPACRPLAQDTARKWEKALKESSYVCNQAAGFNWFITKLEALEGDMQEKIRCLEKELSKGKCLQQAGKARRPEGYVGLQPKCFLCHGEGHATSVRHYLCADGQYDSPTRGRLSGSHVGYICSPSLCSFADRSVIP